ncbi:hypothetical protein [Acaryochloris marina]|uniref:Uncharacterized protein n=1 Tax=Acaryochloris marina (strain MBIC 11017) TaxID=329726 RepID=B0CBB5_ACAM1|nr:hypothetical protein [Acaryochloris marina]ABW27900.1 hypothetical protein AM1_2901 [Acaryochloris marina MBIC11017]
MKKVCQLYRQLPTRLTNSIEIVGIVIGLLMMVILANIAADGSILAFIIFSLITLALLSAQPLQQWQGRRHSKQQFRLRQQRVDQLLAGRPRADILKASPFNYGRWPDGDNNYVIDDQRVGKIVHQVWSPQEAELWILEQTLHEEKNSDGRA